MAHGSYIPDGRKVRVDAVRREGHNTYFPPNAAIKHNGGNYLIRRTEEGRGQFSLTPVEWYAAGPAWRMTQADAHGVIYQPPHPSTTAADVLGAHYAEDDGRHWHIAHCSPDEQIDFAAEAESYTFDQFTEVILKSTIEAAVGSDMATRIAAGYKAKALKKFARACGRDVHERVVGATLGHYHRDPHQDHKRELAIAAITATLATWKEAAKTDTEVSLEHTRVSSEADALMYRLKSTHVIEWRAARENRLARAAAARGDDPVGGYEYVYTRTRTAAVITDADRLPKSAWTFDTLRTGGRTRGSQYYTDGEPPVIPLLPWVIRFRRQVPPGVSAGDAVTAPWEQETAYQPSGG